MKLRSYLFILAALIVAAPAAAADSIGEVVRIKGTAEAGQEKGSKRPLAKGARIFAEDIVTTGDKSRLQIRFIDESTLTLGDKGKLRIDSMIFNPADGSGKQVAKVWGAFRFTSGLIAQNAPKNVTLNMPVATIGIRGTDFISGLYASGMPPGQVHYGVMLISGAIAVDNDKGGVVLDEPGEGTFLPEKGDKAPVDPIFWPTNAMTEAFGSVSFD